jgi:predicted glycosyltransferase involved in capsule biosynthesis
MKYFNVVSRIYLYINNLEILSRDLWYFIFESRAFKNSEVSSKRAYCRHSMKLRVMLISLCCSL